VLDLPGFGRSAPPRDGRYTVGAHARAVVRHLERSGRGPVHLFGNSLGGAVCTRLAADRPDLVRTLTLISPALPNLRPNPRSDPRLPLLLLPGLRALASRQLSGRPAEQRPGGAVAVLRRPVPHLARADRRGRWRRSSGAARCRTPRPPSPPRCGRWSAATSCAARSRCGPVQRRCTRPTLLVWGVQDRLVDVGISSRAVRTYPDARLLVLEDVGHVAQMERPELVARAFLGMLEQIAARRVA
jgi:pimeloyl-ACP methyl ester carboxylesterase